jgi:predicted HicB family RNase H-like nuclease
MTRMTAPSDKRDYQLSVRIPSHLREALGHEAKRERRSIADLVVYMLEDRYAKRKGAK